MMITLNEAWKIACLFSVIMIGIALIGMFLFWTAEINEAGWGILRLLSIPMFIGTCVQVLETDNE